MTRNLKVLGLALAAVLAMTAVAASSASAHYVFTSEAGSTSVTGSQIGKHKFTTGGQSVECSIAKFSGTQTGTSANELTITPTYETCTYAGKTTHVTMNGCDYLFTGATTADGKHGIVHVKCPVGKVIEVHITDFPSAGLTCTLTIAAQTPAGGYTANNAAVGKDVEVNATASGIKITPHGSGNCLFLVTGVYTGLSTLQGYTDGKAHESANEVKISVDS